MTHEAGGRVVWRGGMGWHWRGRRSICDPPHEQAREAGAGGGVVWCCGVSPVPCPPSSSRPVLPLSFVVVCCLLLFFVAVHHSWSFAVSHLLFWAGVGCTVRHWQLSLRLEPRKETDKDILQAQTTVVIGVVHPKRAVWRRLLS
jgi:hypothetical protein